MNSHHAGIVVSSQRSIGPLLGEWPKARAVRLDGVRKKSLRQKRSLRPSVDAFVAAVRTAIPYGSKRQRVNWDCKRRSVAVVVLKRTIHESTTLRILPNICDYPLYVIVLLRCRRSMPDAVEFLLADGLDLALKAFLEFLRPFRNLVKIVIAFRSDLGPNGMNFFNNGVFEHRYSPFALTISWGVRMIGIHSDSAMANAGSRFILGPFAKCLQFHVNR